MKNKNRSQPTTTTFNSNITDNNGCIDNPIDPNSSSNATTNSAAGKDNENNVHIPVTACMDSLSNDLFIDYIFPYVGKNQFRFIAGVNHTFYSSYITVFPKKVTSKHMNTISSISRGILLLQEIGIIKQVTKFKKLRELVIELAARHGTMTIVSVFHDYQPNISKIDDAIVCARAALHGNLLHLKVLREKYRCRWDKFTCSNAALNGHYDVIVYAHTNKCPWDSWTCSNAALNGHLSIVEYAHKNGCPWSEYTCSQAALNGHLSIVQYAHENGCPWNEWTCSNAARNGHLPVIKYAHENGCPWNSYTCSNAAENGHLHIVQYANTNNCEWTIHTLENARDNEHHDIVRYAIQHDCPGSHYFDDWVEEDILNDIGFPGFDDDDEDDDDDDDEDDIRAMFEEMDEFAMLEDLLSRQLTAGNRHELERFMTILMEQMIQRGNGGGGGNR